LKIHEQRPLFRGVGLPNAISWACVLSNVQDDYLESLGASQDEKSRLISFAKQTLDGG
jgi:hypothetical protein